MKSLTLSSFGETLQTLRKQKHLTQQELAAKLGVHRNTIGFWERGDYLPASKGIVLELARQMHANEVETRQLLEASLTALAPYWSVPYARDPLFVGREELFQKLHAHLHPQGGSMYTSYALYGLAGIGKTQMAVEYAYRYSPEYAAILWIEAETLETIVASFVRIAELLQLPETRERDQRQLVAAVQRWLSHHSDWLVIWDNIEDIDLLQRLLPWTQQGATLLTTRGPALGSLVQGIELLPLTPEESLLFLLQRTKVFGLALPREQLDHFKQDPSAEYAAAQELIALMDGLPLALDQVGAYIEETGCGLAAYLRSYENHRRELLARRGKPLGDHPASVAATFSLTYDRVKQVHPAAAELLCLCAFLAPDAIPEELMAVGSSSLGSVLQPVAADPYQLDEAIAVLRSFSLIQRQGEARTLSLHRLTQILLKDQLNPVAVQRWSERAVRVVNAAFPQVEFSTWSVCERYLPQAQVCRLLIEEAGLSFPEAARLLQKMGIYLRERGRNEEAREVLEQALAQQEQQLGPEHPEVATTLNHLAGLYWNLGEIAQMEVLDQRSLRIRQQQLGPTHPLTAEILNDIGYALMRQGHYQQAVLQLDRALATCEQQLGPDHPQTATCLMNLGELYREQKQYAQAEAVLQRALRICEQHLGPDHPWTATCLRRMGNLSQAQGRDIQAEALLRHALGIFERYLEGDHRWIAACLADLGKSACRQDEAKQK